MAKYEKEKHQVWHRIWYQKHGAERREYARQRYQDNHEAIRSQRLERGRALTLFVQEQKVGKECARCGIKDSRVLDFHHLDPEQKELGLGSVASRRPSKQRILDEIAKCELLCANCHRILHWEERENKGDQSSPTL
jgi:hypothetical protein